MHKKPKQFIPQILLSVALLLFFSCTFDGHEHHDADAHQHDGEIILRRISWHELNSSVPKLSHAIKEANAKSVKGTSLLARDGSAEKTYTINTDEVIVISKDGKTTYTFSITRKDETHLTENLVVTLDLTGKMTGRIIVYDLTEQDKTKIEQKQPVDLEGKISYKEVGELTNLPMQLSVSNGSMTLTDCVFSVVIGGGVCPSRQHDLHQMQSGMCSYVNNGSYTPNPETLVQIIVDEDCLNGSTAGSGSGNPSDGNQNPGNPTNPVNNEPIGGNGGNGGNSSNNGNTPEEPDPNSPNPTDPSHDLGGEPVITTPFLPNRTPKTPCGQLNKLNSSPNYEQNINHLKNKATGDKEYGWVYRYFPGSTTGNFAPPTAVGHDTENPSMIDLFAFSGFEWLGAFHNHNNPDSKGMIPMFSPEDVLWLWQKIDKSKRHGQSTHVSEFFIGLVTQNEVYCIKVKDWDSFYTLKDKFLKFKENLEYAYIKAGVGASQIVLQKIFLKALHDLGTGLYEQDENGNWQEITLNPVNNNSNPVKTPCG